MIFSAPGVGVSHFLCARKVGNESFLNNSPGFARGGGGGQACN